MEVLEEKVCFMVWEQPEKMEIIRCKGIVNDPSKEEIISVQGVDDVVEI